MFGLIVTLCMIFFIAFVVSLGVIATLYLSEKISHKSAVVSSVSVCLATLIFGTGITLWFFSSDLANATYEMHKNEAFSDWNRNVCSQMPDKCIK
ncbi:MAG TPA: hypothetical protein VEH06_14835 [Candidatus Bathyarchaeia archaeon]|nr:hypothetical protein [Candidatus Bathyarchaeia archaeon]